MNPTDRRHSEAGGDPVNILPSALWHRIFQHLLERPCQAASPHTADSPRHCREGNASTANGGSNAAEAATAGGSYGLRRWAAPREKDRTRAEREDARVVFRKEGASACWLHARNAAWYGASWPLLCCALASKKLLHHVASFTAGSTTPIALQLIHTKPAWNSSVLWFLSHTPTLPSLHLSFTHPFLIPLLRRPFSLPTVSPLLSSLTSLELSLRGKTHDYKVNNWRLGLLAPCTSLHSLTLGRGAWRFDKSCVAASWSRAITTLTLRANDARGPNLKALAEFTPQLHEFTFYEPESLAYGVVSGPVFLKLDFPRIRRLTFRFVHHELKLRLSLPPAFTSFHASAETLILNCTSASPLVLDQLFLFGKTRLHISSFAFGSVRALYLNGPIRFYPTWPNAYILKKRQGLGMYSEMPPPPFPWADWLCALAPTTEVLIARHDIRLDSCRVAWPRLQSLAIVVECEYARAKAVPGEVTLEDAVRTDASYSVREKRREEYWGRMRERRLEEDRQDEERISGKYTTRFHTGPFGTQVASGSKIDNDTEYDYKPNEDERWESSYEEYATKYSLEPPLIEAPDLKFVFFPTSRRADPDLLGALQAAYPSVKMYCAEGSTWYWEKNGERVPVEGGGPVEHVRKPRAAKKNRSGAAVTRSYKGGPKTVRDKAHSVNRRLMGAGYSLDAEELYVVGNKDRYMWLGNSDDDSSEGEEDYVEDEWW